MKITKITFTCLTLFCLFFSLNLGSQTRSNEKGIDDTPPDVHYEAGMGCIDCHGSPDAHGGFTSGNDEVIPHESSMSFFVSYVSSNTLESAAMNCVNLEGVKKYIENHK